MSHVNIHLMKSHDSCTNNFFQMFAALTWLDLTSQKWFLIKQSLANVLIIHTFKCNSVRACFNSSEIIWRSSKKPGVIVYHSWVNVIRRLVASSLRHN